MTGPEGFHEDKICTITKIAHKISAILVVDPLKVRGGGGRPPEPVSQISPFSSKEKMEEQKNEKNMNNKG